MPSLDSRYENALGDLWQHTQNNFDYEKDWVYDDGRFELLDGADHYFFEFLVEMIHPLVRPDEDEVQKILSISNDWLRLEGWEIFPKMKIAKGSIYDFKYTSSHAAPNPSDNELLGIWEPEKIKLFISHRDKHKVGAKKLGEELTKYGFSCFVAHDSIQPMSTWKNEIMKGLQTMDACVCFITNDFYESEWTNQEVGFALARGIPIYLYSSDKSDPKGFKLDIQAIKTGFSDLLGCVKNDFSSNSIFKKSFIDLFVKARDGSFFNAKCRFFDLVGLTFNNSEIEEIIENITSKGGHKEHTNKLHAILQDSFEDIHKSHPLLRKYSTYMEYLENNILKKHTTLSFSINQLGTWNYELIMVKKVSM